YLEGEQGPTADEIRRFNSPEVAKFRKKLAPYLFVNAVIVVASIFGDRDFIGITVLWSIYMAFKYAKLWSEGYDWRDVFQQPREKELIDVADEFAEYVKVVFNRDKRRELRERNRARRIARRSSGSIAPVYGAMSSSQNLASDRQSVFDAAGPHGERVRN